MFTWTTRSIQFYKQAAAMSNYHQILKNKMMPFISEDDHVLDVGCGLGLLSLQLAEISKEVTAFDRDEDALNILAANIKRQAITNIFVQQGDWNEMVRKPKWDVVVASFFGKMTDEMDKLLQICKKKVIVITSKGSSPNFLPGKGKGVHKELVGAEIEQLKETFNIVHCEEMKIEFGQPFETMEEAYRFVSHYRENADEETIKNHLQKFVVPLANKDFPYYLPNLKNIIIYVVEKRRQ